MCVCVCVCVCVCMRAHLCVCVFQFLLTQYKSSKSWIEKTLGNKTGIAEQILGSLLTTTTTTTTTSKIQSISRKTINTPMRYLFSCFPRKRSISRGSAVDFLENRTRPAPRLIPPLSYALTLIPQVDYQLN